MSILLYIAPHQAVLVLWILFEVAVLFRQRYLQYGMEMFGESAGIYYENLGKAI
jgi:hypothetical protein